MKRRRPPAEVRITLFAPGMHPLDITLSYPLDPLHDQLLRTIHEGGNGKGLIECRMHDDEPRLRDLREVDGRIHGAWMYLRTNPYAEDQNAFPLSLCHWPRGIVSGSHAVPSRTTPEHRRRQEYIACRGSAAGYGVELEKSIASGTVSDVVIRGTETLTAEVQQSGIKLATLLRRDRLVAATDAVPAWFADDKNPPWRFKVAHVETNQRQGMDPGQWTVSSGPRILEHERCGPGSRRPCPDGRNWCNKSHPIWVPMTGVTVDHIVEQVPDGGLVRLRTGTEQGTILTRPKDRTEWLEQYPEIVSDDRSRRSRSHDTAGQRISHSNYAAAALRERIQLERSTALNAAQRTLAQIQGQRCQRCADLVAQVNSYGNCPGCDGQIREAAEQLEELVTVVCPTCWAPLGEHLNPSGRHPWCFRLKFGYDLEVTDGS